MTYVALCQQCLGLGGEVESGGLDEVLCTYCGQHFLRSTNHVGPWKAYVASGCADCRWMPNTDGFTEYGYECDSCDRQYVWGRVTGWELDNKMLGCDCKQKFMYEKEGHDFYSKWCDRCRVIYEWNKTTNDIKVSPVKILSDGRVVPATTKAAKKESYTLPPMAAPPTEVLFRHEYDSFVNAASDEAAEHHLRLMLTYVDEYFDWEWIKETVKKRDIPDRILQGFQIALVCFMFVVLPILVGIGFIK